MGLTIHYSLKAPAGDGPAARKLVEAVRRLALDLPFDEVGDVVELHGRDCDFEARRDELKGDETGLFWLLIQAGRHLECPWNDQMLRTVKPTRLVAFTIDPGPGCEPANVGLAQYPPEIDWDYVPEHDQRFWSSGDRDPRFDRRKWDRYCRRTFGGWKSSAEPQPRRVSTGPAGWRWGSFCKTQYATSPDCGGVPNFLRCHVSLVTLLGRAGKIPGLSVRVDDEGRYGPHTHAADYREAVAAGRRPTYRRHPGLYSPAELAKEVGQWNEAVAAVAGGLGDALGGRVEAPIKSFADFERLEFRGRRGRDVDRFLTSLAAALKPET